MDTARQSATTASQEHTAAPTLSWLTVEVAVYIGLVAAALVIRLLRLATWPLAADELAPALSALRAVRGEDWRASFYSSLVFDLNLFLFALTRATDGAVRLFPALAGAALVGAPYLFRRRLGRIGALAVATLTAFSPLGIYLSRAGDGAILALFCTVLALAALEHERPRWLVVALALGLLTVPLFYTLPIGIAVVVLVSTALRRPVAGPDRLKRTIASLSRADLTLGGVVLALGATAATTNLAGVGATAEVAWRWFADLVPRSGEVAWWWTATVLAFYEPVTVALALVACGYVIRAEDTAPWERGVALWLGWALLLSTAGGQRGTLWIGQAWLPAIILAGRGAERLVETMRAQVTFDAREGVGVATTLVVLCFSWLALAAYQQTGQRVQLSLMIWGLGAGAVLLWGYGLWRGTQRAFCVAVCTLMLVGGAAQVTNASALAYRTGRDPREPLLTRTVSTDIRALEALAARAAAKGGSDRTTLRVVYGRDLDDVLGWVLRDYALAHTAADPLAEANADVWITPVLPEEEWPARLAGQRVALWESLAWQDLTGMERLRWFVTRSPVGMASRESVQVWMPVDLNTNLP